jgi:hypothetical protein
MYHGDRCGWDGAEPMLSERQGEGCGGVLWTLRVCAECGEEVSQTSNGGAMEDTWELARRYRRARRYANLARHYQAIVNGGAIWARVPKAIPRGKPMAWYQARADYYTARAADTHDLYWALCQVAEQQSWLALDRAGKLAKLRELGKLIALGQSAWHDPLCLALCRESDFKRIEDVMRDRQATRDWLLAHV